MTLRTFYTLTTAVSLGLTGFAHAQTATAPTVTMSNQQLADAIIASIKTSGLATGARINLKTINGAVELSGTVVSARQAELLAKQAMTVPGVVKVKNLLAVASSRSESPYAPVPPLTYKFDVSGAAPANGQDQKSVPKDITVATAPTEKTPLLIPEAPNDIVRPPAHTTDVAANAQDTKPVPNDMKVPIAPIDKSPLVIPDAVPTPPENIDVPQAAPADGQDQKPVPKDMTVSSTAIQKTPLLIPEAPLGAVPPAPENVSQAAPVTAQEQSPQPKDVTAPIAPTEKKPQSAVAPGPVCPPISRLPESCVGSTAKSTDACCNGLIDVLNPRQSNGGGLTGGASIYVLRPYVSNNVAYTTTTGLGTAAPATNTTNFNWNTEPAYALWAGYNFADGLGVRGRWFHLDASSDNLNASNGPGATTTGISASSDLPKLALPGGMGGTLFGSPGLLLNSGVGQDLLKFGSSLRIDALDAEATYNWETERWSFVIAGGGRYLSMNQAYRATLSNNPGDGVTSESQDLYFTHKFSGGGPTFDLQASTRICQTNLSLYANGRVSLLVGRSSEATNYTQLVSDPRGLTNGGAFPFSSASNPSATNSSDSVMPVTELELGLEYGRDWGRSHWFVRAGVINQTYFGAGNASRTDGDLSLFGGRFSIGLGY